MNAYNIISEISNNNLIWLFLFSTPVLFYLNYKRAYIFKKHIPVTPSYLRHLFAETTFLYIVSVYSGLLSLKFSIFLVWIAFLILLLLATKRFIFSIFTQIEFTHIFKFEIYNGNMIYQTTYIINILITTITMFTTIIAAFFIILSV